jgi:hypothetical protein
MFRLKYLHLLRIFLLIVVGYSREKSIQFEVPTAALLKNSLIWDIMLCSPLRVNRRFGGTCLLHLIG